MTFGAHVDNAIRQIPGTPLRVRTDLAATLFLMVALTACYHNLLRAWAAA